MRKRFGVFAAIFFLAAALGVPAAQAKRHMLIGLQDDAMVLSGNPTFTFNTMKQLRVQIVRVNLNWNQVAKRRPAHPQDPSDPAYDWTVYDRADRYAGQNGMQLLMTAIRATCRRRTTTTSVTSRMRRLRGTAATTSRTRTDSTRRISRP